MKSNSVYIFFWDLIIASLYSLCLDSSQTLQYLKLLKIQVSWGQRRGNPLSWSLSSAALTWGGSSIDLSSSYCPVIFLSFRFPCCYRAHTMSLGFLILWIQNNYSHIKTFGILTPTVLKFHDNTLASFSLIWFTLRMWKLCPSVLSQCFITSRIYLFFHLFSFFLKTPSDGYSMVSLFSQIFP